MYDILMARPGKRLIDCRSTSSDEYVGYIYGKTK
jgi:hypothetical protein